MTEKKMTTGGFFRALFRHALGGEGENPVHTVIKKGLQANGEKKVIEVASEEGSQESRHSDHEGARSSAQAPKASQE